MHLNCTYHLQFNILGLYLSGCFFVFHLWVWVIDCMLSFWIMLFLLKLFPGCFHFYFVSLHVFFLDLVYRDVYVYNDYHVLPALVDYLHLKYWLDPSIIYHLPFCNTLCPRNVFCISIFLMFLLNVWWILSEFSLEIKASLALCKAIRLFVRILLVSKGVEARGLPFNIERSFGFSPNTNWNGENP